MPMLITVLTVLALLCFLAGTVQIQPPAARPINWTAAGLALFTIVYLLTRG